MGPTVSVCMPASRDRAWFRAALRSVLRQTHRDLEVVVSDDSGGELRAAVDDAADPRVRYVSQPGRLGLAGNHVAALEASLGRYTAFLHDDDEWLPDHLAQAVAVLDADPTIATVLSACEEVDETGALLRRRPTPLRVGRQADPLGLLLRDDFGLMLPSAAVFRRSALDADNPRPWLSVPAADMSMFIDLAAAGWGMHYTGKATMRYRIHSAQVGSDQLVHRDAVVQVWSRYAFADPGHERLRRRRLARDLIARAGVLVRRRDDTAAHTDLDAARAVDRWAGLPRATVLRALVSHPRLIPVAETLWDRVSPPTPEEQRASSPRLT